MKAKLADLIDCATREYSEYSTEMAMAGNYGMESMGEYVANYLLNRNVIVLPYDLKLPENLWRIMFDKDNRAVPVECKVGKITDFGFTLIHYIDGREWNYKYSDLGVHIFYSKEAVEKKIEEQKMNDWLDKKADEIAIQ